MGSLTHIIDQLNWQIDTLRDDRKATFLIYLLTMALLEARAEAGRRLRPRD